PGDPRATPRKLPQHPAVRHQGDRRVVPRRPQAADRRRRRVRHHLQAHELMASVDRRVLPGFSLTLGYTVFYLSILVLLPILAVVLKASSLTFAEFWGAVWTERARAAYFLTFGAAFVAAVANSILGLLLAWVLVRYTFP